MNTPEKYTNTLRDVDKFMYISYALLQAGKENATAMLNELKSSNIKADRELYKQRKDDVVKLCHAINKVFPNAGKYLNKEDKDKLYNAIMDLTGSLWI